MPLRILLFFSLLWVQQSFAQTLSIKEAVETGMINYGTIKAKAKYVSASEENIKQAKLEYLPDFSLSAQQNYGTINGQNGPLYGFGGLGVASSGLPLPEQNWNAAFGALYLANINWEFFTFGKVRQKINLSEIESNSRKKDLEQERFQHQVKISTAYLNLAASQRMVISQERNLERAETFQKIVLAKVRSGLLPGVDSTLIASEVSRAKIALNQVREQVKEKNNLLIIAMGTEPQNLVIDTTFISEIPFVPETRFITDNHPLLMFYKSRIDISSQQTKVFQREYLPSFSFFGIYQTRASGFYPDYATNQSSFTKNYIDGISPVRQNYLLGIGITWNLTSIPRANKKIASQKLVTEAMQHEYDVIEQELKARLDVADTKMEFAAKNATEVPRQVAAAQQAYLQKLTLYQNGLTDLIDVQQTLYLLNRAEIDRDIIYINVWQALLLKAASSGDIEIFMNEFN